MSKKFIFILYIFLIFVNYNSYAENNRYFEFDKGIIALMYHRFDEHKYPSTNIQMEVFKKQIEIIEKLKINFINPKNMESIITEPKKEKRILITIDDGFQSFYQNAWPYLNKKKIPILLFISTEIVGSQGYMNWKQIKELEKNSLVTIGNHSHSHNYLVDLKDDQIIYDIKKSINLFKKNLGYNPKYFSYPFGEYSSNFKKIIKDLNFKLAFGQHSGVIDLTKNNLELPRFPINEKYGDLKRFQFILSLLPLQYKKVLPENKYIKKENNPPKVKISFFENQKNLKKINCYSNAGNVWEKSKISFEDNLNLKIMIQKKFISERGRINCSLHDNIGWRWLGLQFVIEGY